MEEPARIGIADMSSNDTRVVIVERCGDEHRGFKENQQPVRLGDAVDRRPPRSDPTA